MNIAADERILAVSNKGLLWNTFCSFIALDRIFDPKAGEHLVGKINHQVVKKALYRERLGNQRAAFGKDHQLTRFQSGHVININNCFFSGYYDIHHILVNNAFIIR